MEARVVFVTAAQKTDELFRELRRRINSLPDGTLFPSVRQLMRETSASQAVVCQALKRLAKLGLLISSHGHGTFVNRKRNDGKPQILSLFPRYESHTFSELRQELQIAANELQVELVTREVPLNEDFLSPLESCTADAVILMEQPAPRLTFQQITQVVNSPVPTVFCGRKVAVPGIQYVAGNAEAAGLIAACHLWQAGHRKLAVLLSEPHFSATDERRAGMEMFASANDCRLEVFDSHTRQGQSSSEAVSRWLENNFDSLIRGRFTALVVISTESAAAALHTLEKLGVKVPEELSMFSFGNPQIPETDFLSVIDIPLCTVARRTIELIKDRLSGSNQLPAQIQIAPRLLPRRSVMQLIRDVQPETIQQKGNTV